MTKENSSLFPDDYPKDLYERVVADGAGKNEYDVYRVAELGENNRDAFLSSYTEQKLKNSINNRDVYLAMKQKENEYDIGLFSTSCFETIKQAKKILKLKERHVAGPCILFGRIMPETGLSMKTENSKSGRKARRGHIDWWIYKDVDPSKNFSEVEEE